MIKYLDMKNNINYEELKTPAKIIKDGGIVVFPTETVYGIGVNAVNENAIKRIYQVKKRPINNPISLLVSDIRMIENVTKDITKQEYAIIEKFMPGPLTIILKKDDKVSDIVTAGKKTVGIRMPKNEIALNLIKYVGTPIATSSANIAGKPSGVDLEYIMKEFNDNADYYIDGGECKIGEASTIVQIIDGEVHILREGFITKEQIEEAIKNI